MKSGEQLNMEIFVTDQFGNHLSRAVLSATFSVTVPKGRLYFVFMGMWNVVCYFEDVTQLTRVWNQNSLAYISTQVW
jgi:hypothetical protein